MYTRKVITYESENGYSGKLYGESSMSIYDKNGKEVFHTKYRNALTEEDLKEEVDGFPAFMELLKGAARKNDSKSRKCDLFK